MGKINKNLPVKVPKLHKQRNKSVGEIPADEIVVSAPDLKANDKKSYPSDRKKNTKGDTNKRKSDTNSKILFEKLIVPKKLKTKRDKLVLKRKALLNKIDLIKEQELENAKRKKREKTKITGDLNPLKDALPSLNDLLKLKPDEIKTGIKEFDQSKNPKTKKEKFKKRKQEFLDRYKCFNTILKDQKFKQNPRETIAEHIKFMAVNQNKIM